MSHPAATAPTTPIRYALRTSTLGHALVAASDRGVCAILLGDDPGQLAHDLQARHPAARLASGDDPLDVLDALDALDGWADQAVALVEQPGSGHGLPLDARGTAFQLRVWDALCQIPPGATATYADVALRIGRPSAARAVATACAANALAVAIPCHRVVRADRTLSGYRWGIGRKAELLARERAITAPA